MVQTILVFLSGNCEADMTYQLCSIFGRIAGHRSITLATQLKGGLLVRHQPRIAVALEGAAGKQSCDRVAIRVAFSFGQHTLDAFRHCVPHLFA